MTDPEEEDIVADPIGIRLKAAREAQGMSLDDIAAKTRVPIRHLLHMEKGEWDALPAPTYSVGFARAYASAVGLNAAELGSELRAQLGATQTPATPSYYEPADPARVPPRSMAIIAAVVAVLLIIGYLVWRSTAVGDVDEDQVAGVESTPVEAPAAPPLAAPAAPPPAPAAAGGPVVLTATEDVWLRVSDTGGKKLFENTLKAGERFEVPGNAAKPELLTGNPGALQVAIGGAPARSLGVSGTVAGLSLLPQDLTARPATAATVNPPRPTQSSASQPRAAAPAPAAAAASPTQNAAAPVR
jgi:cytoskeletal protein RodZ